MLLLACPLSFKDCVTRQLVARLAFLSRTHRLCVQCLVFTTRYILSIWRGIMVKNVYFAIGDYIISCYIYVGFFFSLFSAVSEQFSQSLLTRLCCVLLTCSEYDWRYGSFLFLFSFLFGNTFIPVVTLPFLADCISSSFDFVSCAVDMQK